MKKSIIIVLTVFMTVLLLQRYNIMSTQDYMLMDTLYQKESIINNQIKIVEIDEKSIEEYGAFGTWSRSIYADFINLLNEKSNPAIIGLDVLYTGNIDEEGDVAFVEAASKNDNVYVVDHAVFNTKLIKEENKLVNVDHMNIEQMEHPYQELYEVTKQGYANTILDSDGYVRRHIPLINYEGKEYNSFAYTIAKDYSQLIGQTFVEPKLDSNNAFGIVYSASNHGYEEVSLYDVLNENIDLNAFNNCIVLLGAHASGLQDAYYVPINHKEPMYGVEIHANIIDAFLNGNTYTYVQSTLAQVIIALAVALFAGIIIHMNLYLGGGLGALLIGAYVLIARYLFNRGHALHLFVFIASIILVYFATVFYHYYKEIRKRRETVNLFKRYVSPEVVDEIIKDENIVNSLGGIEKDIAVMFIDIRGFTTMSEQRSPTEVVSILNEYFKITSEPILKNGGTIDKFIGDAVMAVFNTPLDLDNYERISIQTALEILERREELNAFTKANYGIEIGFGIGIHCGTAVVGNIGCDQHFDFTAIGDCVNTASRIQSISKAGQLLISKEMYERNKDYLVATISGEVSLKGKKDKMTIYEVTGIKGGLE